MTFKERISAFFGKNQTVTGTKVQLVTERGNGIYVWDGKLFESDIVRSTIRPIAVAVGKAVPKHISGKGDKMKLNSRPAIDFLLKEPNPYMSMQQLLEKLARMREISNNAFALITRDENGQANGIYPISAVTAEAVYLHGGELAIKFYLLNGKQYTFRYCDLIHLRKDFATNDIFGSPAGSALASLMTVLGTIDRSVLQAVKNGSLIRWLLMYNNSLRVEDLKKNAEEFAATFLSTESNGTGVAATDSKATATQVSTNDYVPNAAIVDRTTARINSFFGVSEKIKQSNYNEDEWNAFYESTIEPILINLADELTRKLFTRHERAFDNRIVFEASNLAYASMSTKLALSQMVDRGAMTPNEWREIMNKAPIEGGDKPLRRLDTITVSDDTQTRQGGDN